MAIICSKYLSTRDFNWQKETRCFVTEASDLGIRTPHDGRVYDDACDVGFILVSHKTGEAVLFVQDGVDHDGDDGIAGWRYKAVQQRGASTPAGKWLPISSYLTDVTALIIND
jgi:hypothetical protein